MTDERKDRRPEQSGASPPAGGIPASRDPRKESEPAKPLRPAAKDAPESGEGPTRGKDDARPQFVGTGVFWGLVVGIVLSIVVIVFAAQNTQSATVKAFLWEWSSPLFVVILVSLIMGIVLDEIVGLLYRSRKRRRLAEREELRRLRSKR